MHLVAFIIRIYHDARSSECQIFFGWECSTRGINIICIHNCSKKFDGMMSFRVINKFDACLSVHRCISVEKKTK